MIEKVQAEVQKLAYDNGYAWLFEYHIFHAFCAISLYK